MAQDGGKYSVVALEEWCSLYLNTAENELLPFLKPLKLEPVHFEAAEIRVAQAMKEMKVVGEFCSTCQSMLDNWPDFTQFDIYTRLLKGEERTSPVSHSPGSDSRVWTHPEYGTIVDLPYHDDIFRRMASARNGCKFCGIFTGWLEDVDILGIFIEIDRRHHKLGKSSQLDMAAGCRPILSFALYPVPKHATNFDVAFIYEPDQALDPDLSEIHEKYNVGRPTQYPSRLLSITGSVRTVTTDDWTSTLRYATLSHSWGSQKFETLRLANLEQMLSYVPGESLTKTFVDAIGIAQAAGINYLWIDSLCIIQDDYRDWEVEAAKMASVYSGSSLNISASSARDWTEGCFPKPRSQPRGFMHEVRVPKDAIARSGRPVLTKASWKRALARLCRQKSRLGRFEMELTEFVPPSWYRQYVSNTHLASRAWCLQETTLATRTLHCTKTGLYWECRTAKATEDFPNGFFGAPHNMIRPARLVDPDRPSSLNWRSLVERYSACDLTYPGDKLIAISGVARAMMDKGGNQYFAGLWREDIDTDLCWTATEPRPRPRYRAPSWSWAAVDGPIEFAEVGSAWRGMDVHSRVYSVSVKNTGADPCGAVAHGVLTLDCDMVRKGTVTVAPPGLAVGGTRPTTETWVPYADLGHKDSAFRFRLDCSEDRDNRLGQVIYFVPFGSTWNPHTHYPNKEEKDFRHIFGLVVEEVDTLMHEYRRIGHFVHHSCERCDREANGSPTPSFRSFEELLAMEIFFRGGSWINLT